MARCTEYNLRQVPRLLLLAVNDLPLEVPDDKRKETKKGENESVSDASDEEGHTYR